MSDPTGARQAPDRPAARPAPEPGTGAPPLEPPLEELLRELRDGSPERRREAAAALGARGPAAVEPLCAALRDGELEVRIAAADALGRIGDRRVFGPLGEALKACYLHGSARKQRAGGRALAVALALNLLALTIGLLHGSGIASLGPLTVLGLLPLLVLQIRFQRHCSRALPSIAGALAVLAERYPSPELAELVPELQAASTDLLLQGPEARRAVRDAAGRLAPAAARAKELPRPVDLPEPREDLPRPVPDALPGGRRAADDIDGTRREDTG